MTQLGQHAGTQTSSEAPRSAPVFQQATESCAWDLPGFQLCTWPLRHGVMCAAVGNLLVVVPLRVPGAEGLAWVERCQNEAPLAYEESVVLIACPPSLALPSVEERQALLAAFEARRQGPEVTYAMAVTGGAARLLAVRAAVTGLQHSVEDPVRVHYAASLAKALQMVEERLRGTAGPVGLMRQLEGWYRCVLAAHGGASSGEGDAAPAVRPDRAAA